MPGAPYDPAYDPWRGLVSALAWVDRVRAVREIGRLLDTPRPGTRWLSIAACGARRMVTQPGLEVALRGSRTAGARPGSTDSGRARQGRRPGDAYCLA